MPLTDGVDDGAVLGPEKDGDAKEPPPRLGLRHPLGPRGEVDLGRLQGPALRQLDPAGDRGRGGTEFVTLAIPQPALHRVSKADAAAATTESEGEWSAEQDEVR